MRIETPTELLEMLTYDESSETCLRWSISPGKRVKAGDHAGCQYNAYWRVAFKGKTYACHRIVWLLLHGLIPGGQDVDHKDLNKLNNRSSNLRLASANQNQHNRAVSKCNTTGVKGLSCQCNMWIGNISHMGKKYKFTNHDRALVEAWLTRTRKDLHGEFAHD